MYRMFDPLLHVAVVENLVCVEKMVPQSAPCALFLKGSVHFFPQHKTRYAIIGSCRTRQAVIESGIDYSISAKYITMVLDSYR